MKKKHLIMALAIIGIGTFLSVFAQNIVKLSNHGLFGKSFQTTNKNIAPVSSPAGKPADFQQFATIYNMSLKQAQISKLEDHKAIVTMVAAGDDLRGVATLRFTRNPSTGAITDGEWTFLAAYSEDVETHHHAEKGAATSEHEEPHSEGERFVNRGTMRGTISGGNVSVDQNGTVTGLDSVQLIFVSASLEFSNLTQGSGVMSGASLNDESASNGTLTLNF